MLCAIAYVVMVAVHLNILPAAPFLTYDPKDVIITIGGFIYGPAEVLIISFIVAFLEMITVSDTGIIGFRNAGHSHPVIFRCGRSHIQEDTHP